MCSRNDNDNRYQQTEHGGPPMTLLMTCETKTKNEKNKYTKIKNIKIVKTTKKKEKKTKSFN